MARQDIQIIIKSLKENKTIEEIENNNNFIVDKRTKIVYEILFGRVEELIKDYETAGTIILAKKYNINETTLKKYLKLLGVQIKEANPEIKIYKEKKEELIEKYKKGISLTKLAKKYKINPDNLGKKMKSWNIEIDYSSNSVKQYKKDFFEVIDTEEKAYWLGFLYADGCNYFHTTLAKGHTTLELSIKDLEHLKLFAKTTTLNYDDSLIEYRTRIDSFNYDADLPVEEKRKYDMCSYRINCKKIREDLVKQGCIQNKSLILEFPTIEQVPVELQHHFIRGYFDGDGCSIKTEKTKVIGIVGTKNFLTAIDLIFRTNIENYGKPCIKKKNNFYTLIKGGNIITKKISEWLYKDATVYLERKRKF